MRRAVASSCALTHWMVSVWRPFSGSGPLRVSRHSAGSGRPGAPLSSPGGIRAPRPAEAPAHHLRRVPRQDSPPWAKGPAACRWTGVDGRATVVQKTLSAARELEDVLNLAANDTRGHRRRAGLYVRGFGEDRVRPVNSRAVLALRRRDRTGARGAPGRFR